MTEVFKIVNVFNKINLEDLFEMNNETVTIDYGMTLKV